MKLAKALPVIGILSGIMALFIGSAASAHVVVTPRQVLTGERVTFSVSVPNEHDTPVVQVRLVIPDDLSSVRPHAKQGWNIEVTKTGEGENLSATEITWKSAGANVPVDLKDDFLFSAKTPDTGGELKWKAYETYADGTVVAWEQDPASTQTDSKPYSITKVMSQAEQPAATSEVNDIDATAKWALYTGIAGIVLGLIAISLATRKKA